MLNPQEVAMALVQQGHMQNAQHPPPGSQIWAQPHGFAANHQIGCLQPRSFSGKPYLEFQASIATTRGLYKPETAPKKNDADNYDCVYANVVVSFERNYMRCFVEESPLCGILLIQDPPKFERSHSCFSAAL